mmetsp:Transcript_12847/g.40565  ORF Transcript_12847/g.40565 Transcript_12847/m.40565 type:complete len:390 (+) Transcript_12847:122-1291(+)
MVVQHSVRVLEHGHVVLLAQHVRLKVRRNVLVKDLNLLFVVCKALVDGTQVVHIGQQRKGTRVGDLVVGHAVECVHQRVDRALKRQERPVDSVVKENAVKLGQRVGLVHGARARRAVTAAHAAGVLDRAVAVAAALGARGAVTTAHAALINHLQTASRRRLQALNVNGCTVRPFGLVDAARGKAERVGPQKVGVTHIVNEGAKHFEAQIHLREVARVFLARVWQEDSAILRQLGHGELKAFLRGGNQIDRAQVNVNGEALHANLTPVQHGRPREGPQGLERVAVVGSGGCVSNHGAQIIKAVEGNHVLFGAVAQQVQVARQLGGALGSAPKDDLVHEALKVVLVRAACVVANLNHLVRLVDTGGTNRPVLLSDASAIDKEGRKEGVAVV